MQSLELNLIRTKKLTYKTFLPQFMNHWYHRVNTSIYHAILMPQTWLCILLIIENTSIVNILSRECPTLLRRSKCYLCHYLDEWYMYNISKNTKGIFFLRKYLSMNKLLFRWTSLAKPTWCQDFFYNFVKYCTLLTNGTNFKYRRQCTMYM